MSHIQKAIFGGGCFWCTEAVFKMLSGVSVVLPGYAGGTVANPTYEQICTGTTGHAEVVYIEYDEDIVSYKTLLTIFFASHDPTTLNRQGNDIGTQYRSSIFFTTPTQEKEAHEFIQDLENSSHDGDHIVTEVTPLTTLYMAENYHEDYYARNKTAPYCQLVIQPKLEKVQRHYAQLLKEEYR